MDMLRAATAVLSAANLLPDGKLVVGVSGGPDSVALLHLLMRLYPPEQLIVAHLNHGWRESARSDVDLVREMAFAARLVFNLRLVDTVTLARERGWSLEEAGRHARYAFFAQLARQEGADAIAVGHNADDQAETVLLNLVRGTGLDGLGGMRPVAALPEHPELRLVRPLLHTSRAAIEAYCRDHHLAFAHDATNLDLNFARNRVRHALLPLLESLNPGAARHLEQLAELAAADVAILEDLTDEAWAALLRERGETWLRLEREGWRLLPVGLQRRVLRRAVAALRRARRDVGFRTIEQARLLADRSSTGGRATLPDGLTLTTSARWLTLAVDADVVPGDWPQLPGAAPLTLPIPGELALANGWRLTAEWATADLANRDAWQAFVDVGDAAQLVVRGRRAGERLQPLGMHGRSASLQDIMVNRKIPADARARWPIVALPERLVWLVGHQIDARARMAASGQRCVRLTCRRDEPVA